MYVRYPFTIPQPLRPDTHYRRIMPRWYHESTRPKVPSPQWKSFRTLPGYGRVPDPTLPASASPGSTAMVRGIEQWQSPVRLAGASRSRPVRPRSYFPAWQTGSPKRGGLRRRHHRPSAAVLFPKRAILEDRSGPERRLVPTRSSPPISAVCAVSGLASTRKGHWANTATARLTDAAGVREPDAPGRVAAGTHRL